MDATQRHRLHVSIPGDPEWPEGFTIGDVTPPLAVWVLGEVDTLRTPVQWMVTLTGSRAASGYGEFVATELANGAAEHGGIVVGGGAYGGDLVPPGEAVFARIVGVASRHPLDAELGLRGCHVLVPRTRPCTRMVAYAGSKRLAGTEIQRG